MDKIEKALSRLGSLDTLARSDGWLHRLHPGGKLLVTLAFILTTVSFPRHSLWGLLAMAIYPLILFEISGLSFREALLRLRIVLPLVALIGLANPFLDRQVVLSLGKIKVTGGVLSMVSLMLKGCLSVLASYLFIATTPIEKLCQCLRQIHVPKAIVVEVLLIYRYIAVLLKEAHQVVRAYQLRAPGQKGIAYSAWGPLLGQMLLRSMDRAQRVYQSMCLRGFNGDFTDVPATPLKMADFFWLLLWSLAFLLLRAFPVLEWIGGIFI